MIGTAFTQVTENNNLFFGVQRVKYCVKFSVLFQNFLSHAMISNVI